MRKKPTISMAKLPEVILDKIADLIIGEGIEGIPHRYRRDIDNFFNSINLHYSDSESSRLKSIFSDLKRLNIDSELDILPSQNITEVIEYLANPSHFVDEHLQQTIILKKIKELLQAYHLELFYRDQFHNVRLIDTLNKKSYGEPDEKITKIRYEEGEESNKHTIKKKYDLFLSFASENVDQANEIFDLIKEQDPYIEIFMSKRILEGGDIWTEEIRNALYSSTIVILILTPKSIQKEWVLLEAGGAWFQKKKIIPLIQNIDISTLPDPISENQGLPITTSKGINFAVNQIIEKYNEIKKV